MPRSGPSFERSTTNSARLCPVMGHWPGYPGAARTDSAIGMAAPFRTAGAPMRSARRPGPDPGWEGARSAQNYGLGTDTAARRSALRRQSMPVKSGADRAGLDAEGSGSPPARHQRDTACRPSSCQHGHEPPQPWRRNGDRSTDFPSWRNRHMAYRQRGVPGTSWKRLGRSPSVCSQLRARPQRGASSPTVGPSPTARYGILRKRSRRM